MICRAALLLSLALGAGPAKAADARDAVAAAGDVPARPERVLQCALRHATNVDPAKRQTQADIVYEGRFGLTLRLAAAAARPGPPPDPGDPPEPVDPRTAVLADPDHLMRPVHGDAAPLPAFSRVVDLWPRRVEMIAPVGGIASNGLPIVRLIIIDPIDDAAKTAGIYLTTASDAGSIDIGAIYSGRCAVRMP
jgi:hypothetical protein